MPRFLISKTNLLIFFLFLLGSIFYFTSIFYFGILFHVGVLLLLLNSRVRNNLISTYALFSPRRGIKTYNSIVVGDFIKPSCLDAYCDRENTLVLISPDRTLDASYQILQHMTSCVNKGSNCIIVDAYNKKANKLQFSLFDYPFISSLRKKELNLEYLDAKLSLPLFYEPLKSSKILFCLYSSRYVKANCPNQEIVDFCKNQGLNLIYLVKIVKR